MIIIYHKKNRVTSIWNFKESKEISHAKKSVSELFIEFVEKYPKALIIWCHEACRNQLNIKGLETIFCEKNILASYRVSKEPYLTDGIGYVNEKPFINVNKEVVYPTWLMSSDVGGVYAEALYDLKEQLVLENNFDYFLNSIGKILMPLGLFCYSNPKLLLDKVDVETERASKITLFKFVKQHYKTVWIFLLFVNFVIYEKKFPVFAMILSLFYKRKALKKELSITIHSEDDTSDGNIALDVVIPTIGRKKYLYNTLKDLSNQAVLPKQVIIVEQNPNLNSETELDYLTTEVWPFRIKHHFTNQTGACNARNLALKDVESDWVFLADDDIVLKSDFIEKASKIVNNKVNQAFTFNCHLKEETSTFKNIKQWETFGSGCSIVNVVDIKKIQFSMAFEHGFGEDTDFGMQLRNLGVDVIYVPNPSILHLKAPVGGFRNKPAVAWSKEKNQPKPSPTIMLYLEKHQTPKQLLGYKTILFFKYYKVQSIKNPFIYYKMFKKQWNKSQFWANTLKEQQS